MSAICTKLSAYLAQIWDVRVQEISDKIFTPTVMNASIGSIVQMCNEKCTLHGLARMKACGPFPQCPKCCRSLCELRNKLLSMSPTSLPHWCGSKAPCKTVSRRAGSAVCERLGRTMEPFLSALRFRASAAFCQMRRRRAAEMDKATVHRRIVSCTVKIGDSCKVVTTRR